MIANDILLYLQIVLCIATIASLIVGVFVFFKWRHVQARHNAQTYIIGQLRDFYADKDPHDFVPVALLNQYLSDIANLYVQPPAGAMQETFENFVLECSEPDLGQLLTRRRVRRAEQAEKTRRELERFDAQHASK